jgi:hypothetical protein
MSRQLSGVRLPPRDVVELRALAARQPDLASAAELHAELVQAVRRVLSRLTTPALEIPEDLLAARMARGVALAAFGEFPIDWTEVRLLIRQVTDALRRQDLIDSPTAQRMQALGRDATLPDRARAWYEGTAPAAEGDALDPDGLWTEVLQWSLRPFLIRTADVLSRRVAFERWGRGRCPVCAGEPDFAVIAATGERHLLCGRCHARWPFDNGCPFCGIGPSGRQRQFTTTDRLYRITECLDCCRYLKALDAQAAGRSLLPFYDPVATLPIDAAMMKRGT